MQNTVGGGGGRGGVAIMPCNLRFRLVHVNFVLTHKM